MNFQVYKDLNARVELIDHYAYLVKVTAGRLVTTMPNGLEREDIVSAGILGLIKAIDHYDPTRDVKFETYAIALIRGAILEQLRSEDWVPRSIREKLRALDRAVVEIESQTGREASDQQIADTMGITVQEVNELLVRMGRTNVYSLDDILGGSEGGETLNLLEVLVDERANASEELEGQEIRSIVAEGIDQLPDRERLVISLYYNEGLTFKEIGQVMSVSESRVYQLHTQAMTRLRLHMRHSGVLSAH